MGFVEIENLGKKVFEQFPIIKRSCKRIYQLVSYLISSEKIRCEGNLIRISPDDGYEYFHGYYDKSPWDIRDRFVIALKVKQTYKSVAPKESGELVLIDMQNNNKIISIGITHSWNVQQGCMAQWLGPDFKSRIIYNDFRKGKYCSVIFNVDKMKEEKELPIPIYDVTKDGSFALSLDFSRLHRLRPGYGYSNLPDITKDELCPNKTCIWKMDLETGEVKGLFKYTDLISFETAVTMNNAEHKVNHLMINPSGNRFMVLHRWISKGRKYSRLVTINSDGTEMYNLSDDVFVSHCFWKNDSDILSFLRKKGMGDHYYLIRDKTQEYRMYWSELNTDGHCSYSPNGNLIITDTYPNRKRLASIYLCTEKDNKFKKLAMVFIPFRYDNDCRCDLHPRWNHTGDKVCVDSVHNGKRGLYEIPVVDNTSIINNNFFNKNEISSKKNKIKKLKILMINTVPMIYDGITMVMLNYAMNMNHEGIQLDFLAINEIEESIKNTIENKGSRLFIIPNRNSNQFKYIMNLAKLIHNGGYTIVHAHGNSCTLATEMVAAWLGGAKVRCAHSHNTKCTHNLLHKIMRPVFEIFYTHGFACGKEAGLWLFNKKGFVIMNNGVEVHKYKFNDEYREVFRKELNLEGKIVIGHVAHFTPHKNHDFLIDIFRDVINKNPEYMLVLVGSGKLKPDIERKVKELEIEKNVIFVGISTEIPQILSAMDFMVLPSVYEGFPNVMVEWQASGLPILVSKTVTKECKLTDLVSFINLDKDEWVEEILKLDYKVNRKVLSDKAINIIKIKGYDIRKQAEVLKNLYLRYSSRSK